MELGFGRLDHIREKEREQNGAGLWPLRSYQREREREQNGAGLWPLRSYQREREREQNGAGFDRLDHIREKERESRMELVLTA